jgi:hypothetical protein
MNRSLRKHLVVGAAGLMLLATGCDSGTKERPSLAGSVETTVPEPASAAVPSTATPPLSAASLLLSADGLGPVTFGTQAAVAMGRLTQALGRAQAPTMIEPAAACGATRIFRWKNFAVLINEVTARSGGKPGLVGWALDAPAPDSLDIRTDKGIGVGSTVAALKAAYGTSVTITFGAFEIAAPNGAITGALDGQGDSAKVKALQAGTVCGM